MKNSMASLLCLFFALLQVNSSFAKKNEKGEQVSSLHLSETSVASCSTYQCGSGWHPKVDHLEILGASDAACCEATCELWTCGPNFLANPEYGSNVGASDQVCCDRTCQDDFQCPINMTSRGHEHRGASIEECCGPICAVFTCTDGWLDDTSVDRQLGEAPEACCVESCTFFNCSATPGFVTNQAALNVAGSNTSTCCNTQCFLLTCPSDFRIPEELNESVGNIETCCSPLCSQYSCPAGYAANPSATSDFGNSTSVCCMPTCATYTCSGDWANSTSSSKLASTNLTDETCCEVSCQGYSCSADWVPKEGVSADAGNTDAICCDKTCALHTCSAGLRKRNETIFNSTRGDTHAICCEPDGCGVFDNRTAKEVAGCNSVGEAACDASFVLFTVADNVTNNTYAVACNWGAPRLPVCRNTGTPLIGCTVSM